MEALRIIKDEHRNLWRIAITVEQVIGEMERRPARWRPAFLGSVFDYFEHFMDGCHHRKEDEHLFRVLRQRAPSAAAAARPSPGRTPQRPAQPRGPARPAGQRRGRPRAHRQPGRSLPALHRRPESAHHARGDATSTPSPATCLTARRLGRRSTPPSSTTTTRCSAAPPGPNSASCSTRWPAWHRCRWAWAPAAPASCNPPPASRRRAAVGVRARKAATAASRRSRASPSKCDAARPWPW